jgi:hypothetical protein
VGRPPGYQWRPLGLDTDPVPGDPRQISQEAAHLASVAKEISGQVAALHQIAAGGADGALKGQYADTIHSSARDLADQLDKVVGRYQKVSSALNGWLPDLEQAQSMSLQALNDAEGPHKKLNQAVVLPSGNNLTAAQQQSVQIYQNAMKQAQGELDAAKALLGKATTLRDNSASYHAGVINRAIDDGVKDSWWDQFKEWVDHYAWLIKDICTVLEVAAAVLAVLALIFTGVGWIVLLGIALTAVALLGRTMVAAAGDGSWWDVGMDAVALLTFGIGEVGTKALSTLSDNAITVAKGFESAKAADLMSSFEKLMGPRAAQVVMAKFLEKTVPEIDEAARTTLAERLANAGDAGVVNHMKTLAALGVKFGDSPVISALVGQGGQITNLLRANFAVTNLFTVGSLGGSGIEIDGPNGPTPLNLHVPGFGDLYNSAVEDTTTQDGGLSTATADNLAHIASIINPASIPVFQLATGTW